MWINPLVFALLTFWAVGAFAAQDDIKVILREPKLLFRGNQEGKVTALSAVNANIATGLYVLSDKHHLYQFRGATDVAMLSFSNWGLIRGGLNLEVVGADQPDFPFRLAQTHYEIFVALEAELGPGVFYAGYRHRCRHGADNYGAESHEPVRILIRSGPEVGYNWAFDVRRLHFVWNSWLDVYVYSQNRANLLQRGLLGSALQTEWRYNSLFAVFASAGLSATLTSMGDYSQTIASPFKDAKVLFSPGAALGVRFTGGVGDLALYFSAVRNIDSGFTNQVSDVNVVTAMAELLL